ncbi:MAG: phosphoribosyltransferase family protein [Planctomycetia bacterium]|nr:phosphoribosyltransferase family protein [Planctomycetia bacterium]
MRMNASKSPVVGRRVLLVDDVLTSGATCHEAARVLKEKGRATAVMVAVFARGGYHRGDPDNRWIRS